MIDVHNIHQFATQFQQHGMAAHHRMRGIFPHAKKGKQGKPAPTQQTGPLSPPPFSPAPAGTPVQGELSLDWGTPKPAAPSANPLDFTSSVSDHPAYNVRPGGPSADTYNPVQRAKMRQMSANAQAFEAHINSRLAEFRNQPK